MAIRQIRYDGDDILRKKCKEVKEMTDRTRTLIDDMFDTMYEANGVGLAAPQVGRDIRVVVIDLDVISEDFPEYKDFRKVFYNAHIVEYDDSETDSSEEGCLSLPAIHEKVVRPKRVHVKYMDENFQEHDEWVEGYLARVMQHEFDHLEGTMFIDRISPLRKQLIKSKLRSLLQGRFRCGYRVKTPRLK